MWSEIFTWSYAEKSLTFAWITKEKIWKSTHKNGVSTMPEKVRVTFHWLCNRSNLWHFYMIYIKMNTHNFFQLHRQWKLDSGVYINQMMVKYSFYSKLLFFLFSLTNGSLWLHMKLVHDDTKEDKLMCELCGKKYTDISVLRQHFVSHIDRSVTKVQCDICSKWLKNENTLRAHKWQHNQSSLKCPHCDKVKANLHLLRQHITISHSKPTHKCHLCRKSFTRQKSLKVSVIQPELKRSKFNFQKSLIHRFEIKLFYCF